MKSETIESEAKVIIKRLLVSTVLYLPLCFFIWFYSSTLLVLPVKYLLQFVLSLWQPDLFNGVAQNHYLLNIETFIFPGETFAGQGSKLAVLDVTVNPMIYGYGLAVISGLTISMPELKASKKILQIVLGYFLIVFIQTFGCIWEAVKHLMFNGGLDARQAVLDIGLIPEVVALLYQMSYLIFPAVIPVAYWIIMNRNFIGIITGLNSKFGRNFNK